MRFLKAQILWVFMLPVIGKKIIIQAHGLIQVLKVFPCIHPFLYGIQLNILEKSTKIKSVTFCLSTDIRMPLKTPRSTICVLLPFLHHM